MNPQAGGAQRDADIGEANAIVMDRYDLSQPRALALLVRLARNRRVDVGIVAAAIVAAALARSRVDRQPD
jgi:AmiR/NasT family two-component response regulator